MGVPGFFLNQESVIAVIEFFSNISSLLYFKKIILFMEEGDRIELELFF